VAACTYAKLRVSILHMPEYVHLVKYTSASPRPQLGTAGHWQLWAATFTPLLWFRCKSHCGQHPSHSEPCIPITASIPITTYSQRTVQVGNIDGLGLLFQMPSSRLVELGQGFAGQGQCPMTAVAPQIA
jgi:hypothetical protein